MSGTLIDSIEDEQALSESAIIATEFTGTDAVSQEMTAFQGMFSKTAIVTLKDDTKWVVQLRDNEVDITKTALARAKLGTLVPEIHRVPSKLAFFGYIQSYVPGEIWAIRTDYEKLSDQEQTGIAESLAGMLARMSINESSSGMTQHFIRSRLQHVVDRLIKHDVEGVREKMLGLIDKLHTLDCLPLALIHEDINEMNVILNEKNEIAGLIDWEAASILPLGTNLWAIRRLAFRNVQGIEFELPYTEAMVAAWWRGFTACLPQDLQNQPGLVQGLITAAQVGLVLTSVFWPGCKPPGEKALKYLGEHLDWIETTFGGFHLDELEAKPN
ncbi:hypothetical protein ABW19_dt0203705 [Dactylella cylindrospora]|nr:hypothetical protein ABW19_dt0203705 [Dactylella cylindrospora]